MIKTIKTVITLLAIIISFGFTSEKAKGLEVTYGVSESDPSNIELHLSANFEFTYQDLSNPNNKIEIEGTYTLENEKIVLISNTESSKFHYKWVLTNDRTSAKSRKGLCFYRLGIIK
ncbi:MAG: hypothetical protein ACPGD5_06525 [Salibacteraceae bacterium]